LDLSPRKFELESKLELRFEGNGELAKKKKKKKKPSLGLALKMELDPSLAPFSQKKNPSQEPFFVAIEFPLALKEALQQ
jgi:hypothetical protein